MERDPALAPLETRRKALLAAAFAGLLLALAAGAAGLLYRKAFPPWSEFLVYAAALAAVAGWFVWQIPWSLLQFDYKETAARPAVAAWRPGWTLNPGKGLPRAALEQSRFCSAAASQYFSEDLAVGPIAGTTLEVGEVVASRTVNGARGRSRREVLFQGALGRAAVGTGPWKGRYFLRPEGLTGMLSPLPGRTIRLEDEAFEKAFHLTWDGAGKAPDVWTPALRQGILAVRQDTGLGFRLAWDGATLWIGTTSLVDLWEPPLWHRLDDGRRIVRGLQPLEAAARLVELVVREAPTAG